MRPDREQIEKMAQTMCGLCTEDKSCAIRYSTCSEVASQDCSYKESAEELICKGYRNADDVRKETAKEILYMLKDGVRFGWTKSLDITYEEIKERYGVEVER